MMSLFGPPRLSSDGVTKEEENGVKEEGDWSASLDNSSAVALKSAPITLYTSEHFDGNGSQIGACEMFVSYAIKGGKVRVLNRVSAARTLLRGHESSISDLAFAPYDDGLEVLLASADASGLTFVWRLSATDDDDIPCVQVGALEGSRVAWRESGDGRKEKTPATAHSSTLVVRGQRIVTPSDILDLRWSSRVVVLGADQTVRTFEADGLSQTSEFRVGEPCRQVACLGGDRIVALSEERVWILPEGRRYAPFAAGSSSLEAGRRRLAIVDDLLLVCRGSSLRVAHVSSSDGSVDFVTNWTLGDPISSLACLKTPLTGMAEDAEADAETLGFEIQLFCVQPKAIQQFFLRPSACYPPQPAAPPPDALATTTTTEATVREAALEASRDAAEAQWRACESRLERIEGSVARLEAAHDVFAAALAPAVEAAVASVFRSVDAALRDRLQTYERLQSERLEKLDELILAAAAQGAVNSTPSKKHVEFDDDDDANAEDENARSRDHQQHSVVPTEEDQREIVQLRIEELVADGDYDGAIYKAVEASDVDVLLASLSSVSEKGVATMQPLPFQQLTLLCVVQQLAATLDQHPDHLDLKLDWIQLSVLALDSSDVQIASHVPEVLRQLKAALDNLPQNIRAQQQIAILSHIVHSLLNIY